MKKIFAKIGAGFVAAIGSVLILSGNFANAAVANCSSGTQKLLLDNSAANATIVSVKIANPLKSTAETFNGNSYTTDANGMANVGASDGDASVWQYDGMDAGLISAGNSGATPAGQFTFFVDEKGFATSDKIVVKFANAGTYDGKPIDLVATYSNFGGTDISGGAESYYITIYKQAVLGAWNWAGNAGKSYQVSYQTLAAGTNNSVVFAKNSAFITSSSQNNQELVSAGSGVSNSAILASPTNIIGGTNSNGISGWFNDDNKVFAENNDFDSPANTWHDGFFGKNSQITSTTLPLTNSNFTLTFGTGWNYITSALTVPTCPDAPEKSANISGIKQGEKTSLTYTITQRTQGIYTEQFAPYTSLAITDQIDSRFTFDPAAVKIFANSIDKTSEFTIDFANSKLTISANPAGLADQEIYGTDLKITIPGSVMSDTTEPLLNSASSEIGLQTGIDPSTGNPITTTTSENSNQVKTDIFAKEVPVPAPAPNVPAAPKTGGAILNFGIAAALAGFAIIFAKLTRKNKKARR